MNEWRAALIPEGSSDEGLVSVLKRLCARAEASVEVVSIRPLLELWSPGRGIKSKLEATLEFGENYDIFFIHSDTDGEEPSIRRARVCEACERLGVPSYVPVIPIRETEAWLLVDQDAIRAVVEDRPENRPGHESLGLPKPSRVEDVADPKQRLRVALDAARRGQRRKRKPRPMSNSDFNRYRRQLLEDLDIDGKVRQLSAWQALERDLEQALSQLAAAPPSP